LFLILEQLEIGDIVRAARKQSQQQQQHHHGLSKEKCHVM